MTDSSNSVYTDSAAVLVMDKVALDALLRSKWDAMKARLSVLDIEGGLEYFLEPSGQRYREAFNAIADQLPQIIAGMQDIEMIYAENGRAKYRINRTHMIGEQAVTITYYIYFVMDENGWWKIEQF